MSSAVCLWIWIRRLHWGGWVTGITLHWQNQCWMDFKVYCLLCRSDCFGVGMRYEKVQREKNVLLCSQSCACFVNGCCLCLSSQASTFHVFLRKFGSNSGNKYFPAQRVYIFSKHVWDTELLFVNNKDFDCFNDLQRLWTGSSHYSPSMNCWALLHLWNC